MRFSARAKHISAPAVLAAALSASASCHSRTNRLRDDSRLAASAAVRACMTCRVNSAEPTPTASSETATVAIKAARAGRRRIHL